MQQKSLQEIIADLDINSSAPLAIAYRRLVRTPYPYFSWQRKNRLGSYQQAESEFVLTLLSIVWNLWMEKKSSLADDLENLATFSEFLKGFGAIETFVVARPVPGTPGNMRVVNPFVAPKVLLLPQNSGALSSLIEMLEATSAYRIENTVRP